MADDDCLFKTTLKFSAQVFFTTKSFFIIHFQDLVQGITYLQPFLAVAVVVARQIKVRLVASSVRRHMEVFLLSQ